MMTLQTHIDAGCRGVELFSRNVVLDADFRFNGEGGKQERLFEFPLHLCPPGKRHDRVKMHQ